MRSGRFTKMWRIRGRSRPEHQRQTVKMAYPLDDWRRQPGQLFWLAAILTVVGVLTALPTLLVWINVA